MAVIGGFRSDVSITRKTDGNFGLNVSACVLVSKVAYQRKGPKTVVNRHNITLILRNVKVE